MNFARTSTTSFGRSSTIEDAQFEIKIRTSYYVPAMIFSIGSGFKAIRFIALLLVLLLTQMIAYAQHWSEFAVIDVHAHIGTFRGFDLSTATLLNNLRKFAIHKALISNIDGAELPTVTKNLSEEESNSQTAVTVIAHPTLLRGLIWTRPMDGNANEIERFLKMRLPNAPTESVFVGMKFHPEFNNFPADSPNVDPYLTLCGTYHVPAVFHCGAEASNSSASRIYAAARRHPTVPVILYHMGFGTNHGAAISTVTKSVINKDANLYLETSQADPSSVLSAIKSLGATRILFGTDATYFGTKHYDHYRDFVRQLHASLSPADFHAVMHGNAAKLFRL
jgi:predicted TIM-barrel fold metal-dependent hydrolase